MHNSILGPHGPVKCPLRDGFASYITYGVTRAAPSKPKRKKNKKKKQQPSSSSSSTSPLGKSAIIFKIDKDHPEKSYTEHGMSTHPCFRSDIVFLYLGKICINSYLDIDKDIFICYFQNRK